MYLAIVTTVATETLSAVLLICTVRVTTFLSIRSTSLSSHLDANVRFHAMGKRVQYTKITPLPSHVPRQLAIELLHNHEEVIKLNPLVTGVKKIDAPRDAPSGKLSQLNLTLRRSSS